jgi:hypothetical protein
MDKVQQDGARPHVAGTMQYVFEGYIWKVGALTQIS